MGNGLHKWLNAFFKFLSNETIQNENVNLLILEC